MSSGWDSSELDDLLERLCEERLSGEDCARLEQLVVSSPAARRRYVQYMELHGALYWDAAHGEHDDPDLEPAAAISVSSVSSEDSAEAPTPAVSIPRTEASAPSSRVTVGRHRAWLAPLAAVFAVCAAIAPLVISRSSTPTTEHTSVTAPPSAHTPTRPAATDSAGQIDSRDMSLDQLISGTPPRNPQTAPETRSTIQPPASADIVKVDISHPPLQEFIDQQLQHGWQERGWTASPEARDEEWVRRVYLDILGRIPTAGDVDRFLSDHHPDKRQRLVDQLLDHPDYVRNVATVWTNLLVGRRPQPGVDREALQGYLREAFRANRPWKETVFELVSAEGTASENGAANFLLAHLNNQAVPATAVTARLFLGREVLCIQCHAHPFNDSQQHEFWELNGFFKQTARVARQQRDPRTGKVRSVVELINRPIGGPTFYQTRRELMVAAYPKFDGQAIPPEKTVNRRAELARLMTSGESREVAEAFVNRMWSHFFGVGFTRDVDDMGPHAPRSHPELLARLADDFRASNYDVKQLIRWICQSRAYQLSSRFSETNLEDDPTVTGELPAFSRMYLKAMTAEQVYDSLLIAAQAAGTRDSERLHSLKVRDEWVQQFVIDHENDENDEDSSFDGTVAQALMMMNGNLMQSVLDTQGSQFLQQLAASPISDHERVEQLTLAALSRYPTSREAAALRGYLQTSRRTNRDKGTRQGLEDILWVYLNSNEFIFIH